MEYSEDETEKKDEKKKQPSIIKETFYNLKRNWRYARDSKRLIFFVFIFFGILSGISAVIPIFTAKITLNISNSWWRDLMIVGGIVFGIEISRNIFSLLSGIVTNKFFFRTQQKMQMDVAKETLRINSSTFDKSISGKFVERLTKDTGKIADFYYWITDFITELFASVGVLIGVFIMNKIFFAYFALALIVLFIIKRVQTKYQFIRDEKIRKLNEKTIGLVTELVRGQKDIKILNSQDEFLNVIGGRIKETNDEHYKMNLTVRLFRFLSGNVSDIFFLGFILLGVCLCTYSTLTAATFLVLYTYQSRVNQFIQFTATFFEVAKNFNISSRRVFEIIEGDKFEKEIFGTQELTKITKKIEFKKVNFEYRENLPVLKNFNLTIKVGESVGIVGKSGSGKSTVFSLLTKTYDLKKGKILLDGKDINSLTCESIRNNISIITQQPYIFNFSIRENLRLAKPEMTEEEMLDACKTSALHDFVMTLPKGYDTIVGEGGITLSGGQRQRLAIARTLIRNTDIVLFDEATSALDNETQQLVQESIENMAKKHTIIIVAHRLSTIQKCDRIVVLNEGKVIADGKHLQLLKECKEYKELYKNEINE